MASLPLPPLLQELLDAGRWPRTWDEAYRQNVKPRVSAERLAAATDGDEGGETGTWLVLFPPPFLTIHECLVGEREFWEDVGDLGAIQPELALVIGDFGLGSDAPFVLDYERSALGPRVRRLSWTNSHLRGFKARWVPFADTFAELVAKLGLLE